MTRRAFVACMQGKRQPVTPGGQQIVLWLLARACVHAWATMITPGMNMDIWLLARACMHGCKAVGTAALVARRTVRSVWEQLGGLVFCGRGIQYARAIRAICKCNTQHATRNTQYAIRNAQTASGVWTMPVCLFACLPVCLFACLPVCLFACRMPYAVCRMPYAVQACVFHEPA